MRRAALVIAIALLIPTFAEAHPGIGIVRDRQGNVFYTDLVHVWQITPAGRVSIAVRDVHTHELSIDSAGNVYGEDNRYLGSGEGDNAYRHRIWKRSPNGRVIDVVPWTRGFFRAYGFVHDDQGAMYWTNCPERKCSIIRKAPNARPRVVATPSAFRNPNFNFMAAGPNGLLYVITDGGLASVDRAGKVKTIAPSLGEHPMGMWVDPAGKSVYVAVWGKREVVRVDAATGRLSTVGRSPEPWGPSGVLFAPDGSLWLLEVSKTNEVRVRVVAANGRSRVFRGS